MCSLRSSRAAVIAAATGLLLLGGRSAQAQMTDADGLITSGNWLQLGTFANPFGCNNVNGDLLTLHLAPSSIHCLYPEEGDEVEYDTAQASTTAYRGTLSGSGKPMWIAFDDGTDDGILNMDATASPGGDRTGEMMYVATYIENTSGANQSVDFCVSSDDGVQVWLDGTLLHNNNACRASGVCQDLVTGVVVTPGFHRIAMGVWENGGGYEGRLGMRMGGTATPIVDGDPDWFFWGKENPGIPQPTVCTAWQRSSTSPSDPNVCPPQTGGILTVTVRANLAAGANIPQVQDDVLGPVTTANVAAQAGGVVTTLTPSGADTETPAGFIRAWLVLGPYAQPTAPQANPGDPAIMLDYLTDGAGIDEVDVEPEVGDTVNTDFGGAAASTGIVGASSTINPGGVPTWAQFFATGDTVNFALYYGGDGVDNVMMYAVTYIRVADDTTVDLCVGSDDAVQILLDGTQVHINNIARGWGNGGECQDTVAAVALSTGIHKIMVKVFEGGGGHGFRLGIFETGTRDPAAGVDVCLDPAVPNPCVLDPIGVRVTWSNVPRTDVNAGNLKYTINIPSGQVNFSGRVGTDPILGPGSATVLPPLTNYGPIANPAFPNAHNIGAQCAATSITNPAPGAIVITGAGADIWQGGDQFMYAYRPVTGDFSARVTITDRVFTTANRWGKHGIMARQDCSVRSRYSFTHDQGADLQDATRYASRPTHGGADNFETNPPAVAPDNHANTLRLDRCGDEFIGYVLDEVGSFGGSPGDWVEIGRNTWVTDVPATIQLGLAVTSHDGCNTETITFEDWEVLPSCDAPVGGLTCTENASGGLDMTWTNPAGANPGVPIRIEVNDVEATTVPGTSTSASLPSSAFPAGQISKIDVINSSTVAASCSFPPFVTPSGFIKNWLLLGPLQRPGGPAPGDDQIILDFLTDGTTTELNMQPVAGQTINPDYGNLAASTGLALTPGRPDVNPGGVPTWFEWNEPDDLIDYGDVFNTDIDNVMMYAATYVTVASDTTVDIGLDSDDSVQVLLDGVEIWKNNIARGVLAPNTVVDLVPNVSLTAGCHLLVVKVFEGLGGHAFRIRFQDQSLPPTPILPGKIGVTCATVGPGAFRRGDSDVNGSVNITDAVRILNVLFLGIGTITCDDAADSDDNGAVNITDAVRILNVLFLGIGTIGPPGVDACGPDPTDDALQCADYPAC